MKKQSASLVTPLGAVSTPEVSGCRRQNPENEGFRWLGTFRRSFVSHFTTCHSAPRTSQTTRRARGTRASQRERRRKIRGRGGRVETSILPRSRESSFGPPRRAVANRFYSDTMLDAVQIFTKGGMILFSWTLGLATLKGNPVDELIRACLLEERSGASRGCLRVDTRRHARTTPSDRDGAPSLVDD